MDLAASASASSSDDDDSTTTTTLLRPEPGSNNRTAYLFWFHAAQCTFQPTISNDSLLRMIPTRVPWILRPIASLICSKTRQRFVQPRLQQYLSLAEESLLLQNKYLAGLDFTAADITSIYPMDAAFQRYPTLLSEQYPQCFDGTNVSRNERPFKLHKPKWEEALVKFLPICNLSIFFITNNNKIMYQNPPKVLTAI